MEHFELARWFYKVMPKNPGEEAYPKDFKHWVKVLHLYMESMKATNTSPAVILHFTIIAYGESERS